MFIVPTTAKGFSFTPIHALGENNVHATYYDNVRIPAGTTAVGGIRFTGTLADGSIFSGVLANRIGSGYSFLDGFGFINAQSAVNQPLP